MKGVTPIIAIIILLLITISLAGVAYTYLAGYFTGATAKVIQLRDSVKNIALINNIGSQPVNTQTNLVVLVNGIESEILTNELIEPGKSVNLEYVPAVFGNSLNVRIRGPSNFISFITDIPTLTYTAQDEFETFSDGRRCSEDLNSVGNSELTFFAGTPGIFVPAVTGNCYSGSAGTDNQYGASPMRIWAAGTDAESYHRNDTGINASQFSMETNPILTFSFSDSNRVSKTDNSIQYIGDVNSNLEPTVKYVLEAGRSYVKVEYSVRNTGVSAVNVRLFFEADTNSMGTAHFQSNTEGPADTLTRVDMSEDWLALYRSDHTDVIGFIAPSNGEVEILGNGLVKIEETASTSLPSGQTRTVVFYIVGNNKGPAGQEWVPVRDAYNEIFRIVCTDNDLDTYTTCATPAADCNDNNAAINPGAAEVCDNVDNNCVNGIDEGFDADSDTYTTCETPTPDCNDGNAGINPGAAEVCNGVDDNCVNGIDEGVTTTFYGDTDGDGYGSGSNTTQACTAPGGYVATNNDCNDANSAINPGAAEVCTDTIDNNCNTQTDCADSACSTHPSCAPSVVNVQSGTVTLAFNVNSTIVMINEINTSSAFLVFSAALGAGSASEANILGYIVNSTALNFSRQGINPGAVAVTVKWYVANFTSGVYVQRGTTVMNALSRNIAINSVDLTRSFPIISMQSGGSFGCVAFVKGWLTSSTNLALNTGCSSGTALTSWQVVEYSNSIVQSGHVTFDTTTISVTVPITSVNTARSWLLSTTNSSGASGNLAQNLIRGMVTNPTTLTFDRDATGINWNLTWYLVEFTDATSVQHASQSFTTAETQRDVTITSVDLTRSIATAGTPYYRGGRSTTTGTDIGRGTVTLDLTSPTNLRLTRGVTGTSVLNVGWFVVQF